MSLTGDTTFETPTNPQNQCRLLQLPAELRLKIFRLVHRFLTPLHQATCDWDDKTRDWAPLSTQALATCQLYYQEAWQVLYEENVVRVVCTNESGIGCELSDKEALLYLENGPESMPVDHYAPPYIRNPHSPGPAPFQKYYEVLSKIRNIDLHITHGGESHLFVFCRILRDSLRDKNVVCETVEECGAMW